MFRLQLIGTIGSDAEVREVGKSKAINFNVAVNQDYKDANGNKVEKTEWIKAVIWRGEKSTVKIAEFLKKGKKVLLEGEPSADAFINKDGNPTSALSINVKEVEFLN